MGYRDQKRERYGTGVVIIRYTSTKSLRNVKATTINNQLILPGIRPTGMVNGRAIAATVLLFCIAVHPTDDTGAFCRDKSFEHDVHFPLPITSKNLPWVWDASYNDLSGFIEITVASRKQCSFNRIRWKEACSRFPSYRKQFAECDENKVLIDVPESVVGSSPDETYDEIEDSITLDELFGGQMLCIFTHKGEPVYQMLSNPIQGRKLWLLSGAFQIRCPEPQESIVVNGTRLITTRNPVKWDSVSLRRLEVNASKRMKEGPISRVSATSLNTDTFSVCASSTAKFVDMKKRPAAAVAKPPLPQRKREKLSVCGVANGASTSSRSNSRTLLVEWLEYHLAMGVEHFFLYDLALRKAGQRLSDLLTDYIDEGKVTVVPWPYQNCVDGMAAEKPIQWQHEDLKYPMAFQPPREMSRHTAVASCYSRYRGTSEYMAHLDVDEFLALDGGPTNPAQRRKKTVALKQEVNGTSLVDFAAAVFASRPKAVAIRFQPVLFEDCSDVDTPWPKVASGSTSKPTVLPRIGSLGGNGIPFGHHEGKLIVRTEAVGLFHLQAISLAEKGWSFKDVFVPHIDRAAIFQYKKSPEVSGVIWDAEEIPFAAYSKDRAAGLCHYHTGAEKLKETKHRIPFRSREKKRNAASYSKLSSALLLTVEQAYVKRVGKGNTNTQSVTSPA